MSQFDTLFDYTPAKDWLNGRISVTDADVGNITSELNIIANLDAQYTALSNSRSTFLTTKKTCLETTSSRLGNIVNEIVTLESLSNDDKNVLSDFYQTYIVPVAETKKDYMRRMMFNSGNIVADATTLLNDGNITSEAGNCVAVLICNKNKICRETYSFITSLPYTIN